MTWVFSTSLELDIYKGRLNTQNTQHLARNAMRRDRDRDGGRGRPVGDALSPFQNEWSTASCESYPQLQIVLSVQSHSGTRDESISRDLHRSNRDARRAPGCYPGCHMPSKKHKKQVPISISLKQLVFSKTSNMTQIRKRLGH